MTAMRMFAAATATALTLGGCAMTNGPLDDASPGVVPRGALSPAQAQAQVRAGVSTKAEVATALGRANVIAFDSGWEVWVYRWMGAARDARSATELVVAFDPAGTARKVRVRPGSAG